MKLLLAIAALGLAGCQTVPAPVATTYHDVHELCSRPDFAKAYAAAPDWVTEALTRLAYRDHTLNEPSP